MEDSRIKIALRYVIKLVPIAIIAGASIWFFWLRTSGQTATTTGSDPETTQSGQEQNQPTPEVAKVDDNAPQTAPPSSSDTPQQTGENLPASGPNDTLTIFILVTIAGTLFWKWRLSITNS